MRSCEVARLCVVLWGLMKSLTVEAQPFQTKYFMAQKCGSSFWAPPLNLPSLSRHPMAWIELIVVRALQNVPLISRDKWYSYYGRPKLKEEKSNNKQRQKLKKKLEFGRLICANRIVMICRCRVERCPNKQFLGFLKFRGFVILDEFIWFELQIWNFEFRGSWMLGRFQCFGFGNCMVEGRSF